MGQENQKGKRLNLENQPNLEKQENQLKPRKQENQLNPGKEGKYPRWKEKYLEINFLKINLIYNIFKFFIYI